ncbi:MAG: acyl carrier protein [Clostridia bacterium]|jgi:acyl carrier protein|nr:acyl carrier protein [Clostridia bacterium]MBQ6093641.1 acyl carrier protein [Clostridia bacterium]MBR3095537.1 acyl carrier protein [Clostridia bacterium]
MDIQKKLLEILSDYTDGRITTAKADDVLTSDFGLNSFELFDLVCIVEETFDISIPDRMLPQLLTVGDFVHYLDQEVNH